MVAPALRSGLLSAPRAFARTLSCLPLLSWRTPVAVVAVVRSRHPEHPTGGVVVRSNNGEHIPSSPRFDAMPYVVTCAVSATGAGCFNKSKNVTPLGMDATGRVSNYALRAGDTTFGLSAVRYV